MDLTLGVQTRWSPSGARCSRSTSIGNTYVNRNMIGAVVGVQPFGGTGLVRHGPQGRRSALLDALRERENVDRQYHGDGRQRRAC